MIDLRSDTITLPTDEIEQMKSSGQSLMPERQLDKLTREQLRDLFAYLATKK